MTATLRTVGHGFEIADEGFYLLPYRWWDANHLTFTGAQYFYGPVFELLGHNIAALRNSSGLARWWARMCYLTATSYRWLRLRRPHAPPPVAWESPAPRRCGSPGGIVLLLAPLSPLAIHISFTEVYWPPQYFEHFATDVQLGSAPLPGCSSFQRIAF